MHSSFVRRAVAAGTLALLSAGVAAGTSVRFSASDPAAGPFPSNRFTVPDFGQNTLRRVALPKPDCNARPSDCEDIDVLNTLDGFSTQPRITIPFTGDIDPATVTSDTVYLVSLGDTVGGGALGERVGINQVLWDLATKTLVVESDQLLRQHTRYLLVVTRGVLTPQGRPVEPGAWAARDDSAYRHELRGALALLRPAAAARVVAASLFTTQSATTELGKINAALRGSTPGAVDFMIGNGGSTRALFAVSSLTGATFNRQTGSAPAFTASSLPLAALAVVPGAVGQVAYGRFRSPDYATPQKYFPPTATRTRVPQPQGTNEIVVQVFLPAGQKPAGGWPVAIFGHGFTDSMVGAPWTVASVFASQGLATVAINVVGHGGGALGTLDFKTAAGTVSVPAGGRGFDQDGNGAIDSTEGVNAAAPRTILGSRDGLRQTVVDLMQLVRQLQAGIDVDGDQVVDLSPQRLYYAGQSFGGIYGTILLGSEPAIAAGVPNVPGGSITEVARLGGFRFLSAQTLATRTPQLLNLPPLPGVPAPFNLQFNENIPLRNQPPVTNSVAGAMDIQLVLDRFEWAQQSGNPVSYAAQIQAPVIFQFAKGDQTVPNPTTSAILRAGNLASRATYYRNDLTYAQNPAVGKNPHTFLTNIGNAAAAPYAVAGQQQIATFFASGGATVIDPDGANPFFEVPIAGPLPETLNYIP